MLQNNINFIIIVLSCLYNTIMYSIIIIIITEPLYIYGCSCGVITKSRLYISYVLPIRVISYYIRTHSI